ncbi:MAG: NUDIX domain-containing protein [Candidatus Doudnabacteria bacterium]|nr:NUDIX domain-containing protein [Candidatus Doudnabacteria bacterium]
MPNEEPIPTVAVIALRNDEVAMIKHSESAGHITGIYGLPGGHIDPGETEKQAAVKELFEEAGLITTEGDIEEFPSNSFVATIEVKGGSKKFSWKVFLCRNFNGELQASVEGSSEWVKLNNLKEIPLLPNVKEAIEAALKVIHRESEGRKLQ